MALLLAIAIVILLFILVGALTITAKLFWVLLGAVLVVGLWWVFTRRHTL